MQSRRSQKRGSRFVVGLMSGTSADGIDAVVAEITARGGKLQARVAAHTHTAFAPKLRQRIHDACSHGKVAEICELNFILGDHFARAAQAVIREAKLKPKDITAIGSHGQTIHHLPNARTPSTLQIGEAAVIAERTGITTIADFRVRDMAAGGQGAPLVPFADWILFTHQNNPRILQNIGGIGNLTFLPAAAMRDDVVAFDTGPGNMIIDGIVGALSRRRQSFDRNGRWAARGIVCEKLLAELMTHPFLRKNPPKTTGREEFGEAFVRRVISRAKRLKLKPEDLVATATAFTAASIADAYRRFVFPRLGPDDLPKLQIILGGGGAKNPELARMLKNRMDEPCSLLTLDNFGIDNAAKEPLAFAILAHETLFGRPSNVPSATGASKAVILGKIIPGSAALHSG